jgi:hypothetical protein
VTGRAGSWYSSWLESAFLRAVRFCAVRFAVRLVAGAETSSSLQPISAITWALKLSASPRVWYPETGRNQCARVRVCVRRVAYPRADVISTLEHGHDLALAVALCHFQESGWGKKNEKERMRAMSPLQPMMHWHRGERGRTRDVMIVNAGQGEAFLLPRPPNGIALVAIKTARGEQALYH